jgi:hypothetical protein
MSLNLGGDDITEFLYVLLERISFPYRDLNLARWYDWTVMEDLKARLCTLAEVGIRPEWHYGGDDLNCMVSRETWHSTYMTFLSDNRTDLRKNMGFERTTR